MAPTLATTWAINSAAGQAPSVVRVRNLQSTTHVGLDGWSRPRRPQPLLVSAGVSLASPSNSSSSTDRVAADTVHYGHLSKAILSILGTTDSHAKNQDGPDSVSLRNLLDEIWARLTGRRLDGSAASGGSDPFLDLRAVSCLSITLQLPKASLIGGVVSLTGMSLYEAGEPRMYGVSLGLSNMRVPTLIGVNDNERLANQVVIADVEIDCFEDADVYPQIGQAIYERMAGSSYATLEALAVSMDETIRAGRHGTWDSEVERSEKWHIKIKLEKPIAVPLAEGAGIEFISPARPAP